MIDNMEEFVSDINRDSLMGLSITQKLIYYMIIQGRSNGEIAERLKMNVNSVKTVRTTLKNRINEARALVEFADKYGISTDKRRYSRKNEEDNIARIDENGSITDYLTGAEIHSVKDPKYHASVIVLPVRYGKNGPEFPIALKDKGHFEKFTDGDIDCRILCEIVGTHVRRKDTGDDNCLNDALFGRTAVRALREELYVPGVKEIDRSSLRFLGIDEFSGVLETGGLNVERSALYLYRLPDGTSDVRYYTSYTDTANVRLHIRLASKWVSFPELEEIVSDKNDRLSAMNGLKRIVRALSENTGAPDADSCSAY